jgi:hypothetical protein
VATTQFDHRTTARAVAFGDESDDAVLAAIAANLPQDGIAAAKVTGRRALPPSGNRMLDNRILATALHFLEEDLDEPFLRGLSKYRALVKVAKESLADPEHEVMVTLIEPYEITSTQRPYVTLIVDDHEIARVSFELTMVFGLFETAVAIRHGAIESVECDTCSLALTLSLADWKEPLVHRKIQLPVHLPVRPPIMIPLAGGA